MNGLLTIGREFTICLRCRARLAITSHYGFRHCRTTRSFLHDWKIPKTRVRRSAGVSPEAKSDFRHIDVRQQQVSLGVDSLGEPAQIRIVRDRPEPTRRKVQEKGIENLQEPEDEEAIVHDQETLRQAILDEKSTQGPDSWKQYIEALKSSYLESKNQKGDLSVDEAADLARKLEKGFTSAQLSSYLQTTKKMRRRLNSTTEFDNLDAYFQNGLIRRSKWVSGETMFPDEAVRRVNPEIGILLQDKIRLGQNEKPSLSKKQMRVEEILRRIWNVRTRSERSFGELDIQIIQEPVLDILLENYQAVFESKSRQFNVNINISPNHNLVRLSGEFDLVSDVYKLMYDSIMHVSSERLQLSAKSAFMDPMLTTQMSKHGNIYDDTGYTEQIIQEIGRLTKTKIALDSKQKSIYIWHISTDKDALEDAKRLLLQFLHSRPPKSATTIFGCSPVGVTPSYAPIFPTSALALPHRYLRWYRLHCAMGAGDKFDGEGSILNLTQATRDEVGGELLRALHKSRPKENDNGIAVPTIKDSQQGVSRSLRAHIGYIVRPQPTVANEKSVPASEEGQKHIEEFLSEFRKNGCALITDTPGQSRFLQSHDLKESSTNSEFVIYLRPQVSNRTLKIDRALETYLPSEVRLHVEIDSNQRTTLLRSVRFVNESVTSNLLLPSESADIRFITENYIEMQRHFDTGLLQFFEQSNLNIWGSGKLRTPTRLTTTFPDAILSEIPADALCQLRKTDKGKLLWDYSFAALEHRSQLRMGYKGHVLTYTTVQGGKAKGQSGEFTLHMNLDDNKKLLAADQQMARDQERVFNFVDCSTQLVSKLSFASVNS